MTTTNNDLAGIQSYSIAELYSVAPDDRHAVRDEVVRRCDILAAKHRTAARKVEKLLAEMKKLSELFEVVA